MPTFNVLFPSDEKFTTPFYTSEDAIKLTLDNNGFAVDFGPLFEISGSDIEIYRGDYIVEPDFTEQVLATKNKMLMDNVKVSAIEVQRVSNTSGGRTVYIGGLING